MKLKFLSLPALILLVSALGACDSGQNAQSGEPQWTAQSQIHRDSRSAVPSRGNAASPEARAREFFQALQANRPEQAAELVAKRPMQGEQSDLLTSLSQFASQVSQSGQEYRVIDSNQRGDFALVRVDFFPSETAPPSNDSIRPVVMFREEGNWKVVWDLLGKEPERLDPATAQRLEPLYSWYDSMQLRQTARSAPSQPAPEQSAGAAQGQSEPQGSAQQGRAEG